MWLHVKLLMPACLHRYGHVPEVLRLGEVVKVLVMGHIHQLVGKRLQVGGWGRGEGENRQKCGMGG